MSSEHEALPEGRDRNEIVVPALEFADVLHRGCAQLHVAGVRHGGSVPAEEAQGKLEIARIGADTARMGLFSRGHAHAGGSAARIYRSRYRAWRTRIRVAVVLAMLPVLLITAAVALGWSSHRAFVLGFGLGSSLTLALAISLAAPEHVDRWRRGADAERSTGKQLRRLAKRGWVVIHDLPDGPDRNRDHVVVAPSGQVFLLDTKAPGGRISVQQGVLEVRWLEDPNDGYRRDLTPAMKASAASLADDLRSRLGRRPWVTPVVVIWGRWEGPPHMHDGVAWVPGRVLAERLAAHAGDMNPSAQGRTANALRSLGRADSPPGTAAGASEGHSEPAEAWSSPA